MNTAATHKTLRVEHLGRIAYGPALALQEARHQEVCEGRAEDTLFLLEHAPVVTLGKNTQEGHVLLPEERLSSLGVEVHRSGRGGDVTFHGPGQIVGYPILALQPEEQDIKRYVWRLEEILIRTVADFGVHAARVEGLRGIWVGNSKIGAIGVRLSRWVTMHGFALNVDADLQYFDLIVPCGLRGRGVTSLQALLGDGAPTLQQVNERIVMHAADVLERSMVSSTTAASPRVEVSA